MFGTKQPGKCTLQILTVKCSGLVFQTPDISVISLIMIRGVKGILKPK